MREEAINLQSRDPSAGHALSSAPTGLLALTVLTLSLTPAFLALTGFDLVAGDLQHRAVRYWTVRVRRASYIGGKFLGLWAAASAVVLLLHLACGAPRRAWRCSDVGCLELGRVFLRRGCRSRRCGRPSAS